MSNRVVSSEALLRQLRWRYATKKFDPARRIPPEDWQALEEVLVLSPSSFGLQPWRFVIVTNARLKEQLVPLSWWQSQVADASHVVVFAVRQALGEEDVERLIDRIVAVRGVARESLASYRRMMLDLTSTPQPGFDLKAWCAHQVYIALGNLMNAAALLGIDTCPMEGIEAAKYDEVLGLTGTGYSTLVTCAAGYRDPNDKHASAPKVRYEASELIIRRD